MSSSITSFFRCKPFFQKMLKLRGKELSGKQLNRVSHVERTDNPLFLKIILEVPLVFGIFFVIVSIYKTRIRATLSLLFQELCAFGSFRQLDQKIDSLVACKK